MLPYWTVSGSKKKYYSLTEACREAYFRSNKYPSRTITVSKALIEYTNGTRKSLLSGVN